MHSLKKTLVWVTLFAVAMGFLETSVVVYLRALYYPNGFNFPLKPIPIFIAKVEFFREAATIIMLLGCGIMAGKTPLQRFAYFVLAFAIWDLCYYLFFYVCLSWPQSLADPDILFLIPVPWVGPVWAPCLLSLLMIVGALYIIFQTEKNKSFKVSKKQWLLMIGGALICMVSFMWDYLASTLNSTPWSLFSSTALFSDINIYVPASFNSLLFFTGFISMCTSLIFNFLKPNQINHENK